MREPRWWGERNGMGKWGDKQRRLRLTSCHTDFVIKVVLKQKNARNILSTFVSKLKCYVSCAAIKDSIEQRANTVGS